jgi:hypothetical protein
MVKNILIAVAVLVVIFVGVVITRPDTFHVERRMIINAPDTLIYANLDDLHAWAAWSPWEKLDPNMKKTFSGPARGIGASYAWEGNSEVGKGKMTIIESSPATALQIKLEFIEPFASEATHGFELYEADEGGTNVTWWMDGHNNFVGKTFCLFMDMDKVVGADFEKGLKALKSVSEAQAKKLSPPAAANAGVEPNAPAAEAPAAPLPGDPAVPPEP